MPDQITYKLIYSRTQLRNAAFPWRHCNSQKPTGEDSGSPCSRQQPQTAPLAGGRCVSLPTSLRGSLP